MNKTHPKATFVNFWHEAFPDVPNALGGEAEAEALETLQDWIQRNVEAHAAYRRGEVPREKMAPRTRGRGAASALVSETPEESEALFRLLSMAARVVVDEAEKCALPLKEALEEAPEVFIRSMRGFRPDRGNLRAYLYNDFPSQFRYRARMRRRQAGQKIKAEASDARSTSPLAQGPRRDASAPVVAGMQQRFDAAALARAIIEDSPRLKRLWNDYLRPGADRADASA